MASRVAKKAVDEGRKFQSSRQQEIVSAMKMAMLEANDETVDPITSENEPLPPPTETNAEKLRNAEWSALVNDFLTDRLLASETGTTTDDASTSLESRLHRIVAELDAENDLHPAVKSAIRIRIAESYLKLTRHDDAAVQCQKAMDLLERTYSIKHPYSIRARQNLAVVRLHQGQITEAAQLYQQLHEIRMVENGSDDPKTVETLRIASMLRSFEANPMGGTQLTNPPPRIQSLLDLELPSCRFLRIEF